MLVVGELRARVEKTDDDVQQKMPWAEREARKDQLKAKLLLGVKMEGTLDPANCLVNRFFTMAADGNVEWVPREHCPWRSLESSTNTPKKKWLPDAKGVVRERTLKPEPIIAVNSTMNLDMALKRRGMAMEVSGVMSYEKHELLRERLIGALNAESPDPRVQPASLDQVKAADRKVWEMMAYACRYGLRPTSGVLPMDAAIEDILKSMDFSFTLIPLPLGNGKRTRQPDDSSSEGLTAKKKPKKNKKSKVDFGAKHESGRLKLELANAQAAAAWGNGTNK